MRIKPSLIIDALFCAFIWFILIFVILYYFFPRPLAITFSAVIAFLLAAIFIKRALLKQEKIYLSQKQKKERDAALTALKLSSHDKRCATFEKALNNAKYSTEYKSGGIIIKDKNSALFPLFSFDSLTKTDVVKVFNSVESNSVAYILCDDCPPDIKNFADRFDGRIKIYGADEAYKFLSDNKSLPEMKFALSEKKPLTISAFKNIFQKKKAKSLLGFGLIFIAMSYFVSIKTYYVVCGCAFLFLALICRLYGK